MFNDILNMKIKLRVLENNIAYHRKLCNEAKQEIQQFKEDIVDLENNTEAHLINKLRKYLN